MLVKFVRDDFDDASLSGTCNGPMDLDLGGEGDEVNSLDA